MISLAIPLTLIVTKENAEINLLKQEKIGTAIIPQLQSLNVLLAQHRGTANRLLNGNQQVLPNLAELENKIDQDFNHIIQFCDIQKNNLNAPFEKLRSIQLEWQTLKKNYQTLTSGESFTRHKNLIFEIMAFQTTIADSSNLSLDSQLASYYLMDNMVKTMPILIENLGQVRGFGSGLAARHHAIETEKHELIRLSYSVKLAMQSVHFELEKVFIRLPVFAQELEKKLDLRQKNIDDLLAVTEQEIIHRSTIVISDKLFYHQATDAIAQVMQLYESVATNLNNELDRRISELLTRRYSMLASFLILFIVMSGFIHHIVNRINKPLQHAIACFEKISVEQYDYPITIIYKDEIGCLLQALQIMRNQLVNNIEQLKNTLSRLVDAQRIAKMGDLEWDIEKNQLIYSEQVYAIFDIQPNNISLNYDSFLSYIVPHDQTKVKAIINQALKEQGSYVVEYCILSAKGQKKVIYQCMETISNANGKIIRIIGTLQDVTLQREMEFKARLAAQVFEHIGEAIIVTNEENKTILVNKAFSNITGYAADEIIGKKPHFLNSTAHDKDFYDLMWESINKNGVWQGEIWNRRKDNVLYPEALTVSTIKNSSDEVINYIGVFADITERKQKESLLKFRLKLNTMASRVDHLQLMQTTLDMAEDLTGSSCGFFHYVEKDQDMITLQAWSTNTLKNICKAEEGEQHYPVSQAGVWADAIRTKAAVIQNDYPHLDSKKGMPEGHAVIERFISIPIIREDKVVALIGVGNKPFDYLAADVDSVFQLADAVFDIIQANNIQRMLYESEQKLQELNRDFVTFLENTSDFIYFKDENSGIRFCSQTLANVTHHKNWRDLIGKHDLEIFPSDTAQIYYQEELPIFTHGEALLNRVDPYYKEDGSQGWVSTSKWPVFDESQKVIGIFGISRDITELKRAETELRIAATVFEAQEGMFVTDAKGIILKVNHAFTAITGYSAQEVINQTPRILSSGRHDKTFYSQLWQTIHDTGGWQGEIWDRRKNAEIYPQWLTITAVKSNDVITHYVATLTDITERKVNEERINRLAFYDSLTQLPNRRLLQERIKHGIDVCRRTGSQLAVFMLDLDKFKPVNDNLGHAAGDVLLQQVAIRIKNCIREIDTAARLGGDEFVILMENIEQYEDVNRVANAVIYNLSQPFSLNENCTVHIGASIGISIYPGQGNSMEELLDNADTALYAAKNQGRGCFNYFSEEMIQKAQ